MECRFENDLFLRLALRFVEARSRLGLAEDVADPVVADAIARSEVPVRVVVESAPADAARVLGVRSKLIMHPRMADGVFAQPLKAVDGLGRKGVADELGVEILRMIRRQQRPAEVVHGENIFEKLRLLEVE